LEYSVINNEKFIDTTQITDFFAVNVLNNDKAIYIGSFIIFLEFIFIIKFTQINFFFYFSQKKNK